MHKERGLANVWAAMRPARAPGQRGVRGEQAGALSSKEAHLMRLAEGSNRNEVDQDARVSPATHTLTLSRGLSAQRDRSVRGVRGHAHFRAKYSTPVASRRYTHRDEEDQGGLTTAC